MADPFVAPPPASVLSEPAVRSKYSEDAGEVELAAGFFARSARLFVGNLAAAESAGFSCAASLTHVLTAAAKLEVELPRPDTKHLVLGELVDHPACCILSSLVGAFAFLDEALAPRESGPNERHCSVLVHCASGVSRSVSVVMAYLVCRAWDYRTEEMTYPFRSFDTALAHVRANRPAAMPNLGFVRQLQLLIDCQGDVAEAIQRHVEEDRELKAKHGLVGHAVQSGSGIMAEANTLRDIANKAHAQVDVLENEIAGAKATHSCAIEPFLFRLHAMMEDTIDPHWPDCEKDRVAKMIMKSARSKAQRLVDDLQAQR